MKSERYRVDQNGSFDKSSDTFGNDLKCYCLEGDLEIEAIMECDKTIHCCRFSPNGDIFALGQSDGTIKIFKRSNCQLIYSLIDDDVRSSRLPVTSIRFYNPPNDPNMDHYKLIVACYVSGFVKFWHYPSKTCAYTIYDNITEPLTIDFNKTYDTLAVGGYNNQIHVFDVQTKKLINTLESSGTLTSVNGHSSRVYCIKYHPNDKNQLFSGGWDDTVQIWDHRVAQSKNYIYGPHICGDALDIDLEHNHLLTGSWRKSSPLQIWDLRNYQLIRDVFKEKSKMMIYGCQWLATDYIFMCGSEKNSAAIYDRGTLKSLGGLFDLKNPVTSIDNDRNGEMPNLLIVTVNLVYLLKKKSQNSTKKNVKIYKC